MKMNISKFYFYFCLQYALIINFYDFHLSFLKIVLKSTLYGLLAMRQVVPVTFYNFKKINTCSPFLDNPCIPHFKSSICFLIVFVVWLTDERRLALFPAGTIVRDPYHLESQTCPEQDLNLRRT